MKKAQLSNESFMLIFLAIFMVVMVASAFASGKYFVLNVNKSVEANKTASYLNWLPEQGVMSQIGYSPELNYQTDKNIISMPNDPDDLDRLIKDYNISYLLYGERYWEKWRDYNFDRVMNHDTISYIMFSPKFKLIKVIYEDYGDMTEPRFDKIFIYLVVKEEQ